MGKKETFRVKAAADAPEFVAHGNLEASKVGGYYETENERFADHLRNNYGAVTTKKTPAPKRVAKPKKAVAKAAEAPTAASSDAGEKTEEVNNNG